MSTREDEGGFKFPVKEVQQFEQTLNQNEFCVRVVSYHMNNEICGLELVFQATDIAGDFVSKITVCNTSLELMESLGKFLFKTKKELAKVQKNGRKTTPTFTAKRSKKV